MELINSVYFLLMIGLIGSLLYIVNIIYIDDNKKVLYVIFFPPYIFYYCLRNIEKTKNSIIMAVLFYIVIYSVGFIASKPYGQESADIICKTLLWPYYLFMYYFAN